MKKKAEKHQKHAKIARPAFGTFTRNEWAFIGAPCGAIKQLAFALTQALSDTYRIGYVDADHQSSDAEADKGRPDNTALAFGSTMEYTDKITFHRLDFEAGLDNFQFRTLFNDQDAVLVNGNHFLAKQQIVILDARKAASLQKKTDRLKDVQLFLATDETTAPYDFLKEVLPNWASIPILSINDHQQIAAFLRKQLKRALPPLSGLVLAGGRSQRMGRDKGLIDYHGKPQREYLLEQLGKYCGDTWLSCRPEQQSELTAFPTLADTFAGLGPFGAILSAFRHQPDHAWLVAAVDLPLLDDATLQQLCANRNPSKIATAFLNPATNFPDPLLTIWEPRSYPILLQFLAQGYSCPRKVLINSSIELLEPQRPAALTNANSPEEYERIMTQLR